MADKTTLPQKADTTFNFSENSFNHLSPFRQNTPEQTEEQRNWGWGAPPAAQTIPEEPPAPSVSTSDRPIANFRRKIMPAKEAPKAQEEEVATKEEVASKEEMPPRDSKNVRRLKRDNTFLKESLKSAYLQIQDLQEERAQQQVIIDKQDDFHKTLDRTTRELVEVADNSEKNFRRLQAEFIIQQNDIAGLRQGADELKKVLARMTDLRERNEALEKDLGAANIAAEEKAKEQLGRVTELQTKNEALEKDLEAAKMAAEEKSKELLGRMTELQNTNEALEGNLGPANMATEEKNKELLGRMKDLQSRNKALEKNLKAAKLANKEKTNEQLGRMTDLQNRNEALERDLGAAKMAAEEKASEQLGRMIDLQNTNEALEKSLGAANVAAEEKVDEQLGRMSDLQTTNKTLEKNLVDATMAASQQQAQMEELRVTVRLLEQQREGLNTEFESMLGRLEAAEKKLSRTSVSYRQAQTAISNNNATIKGLERQISKLEQSIGQQEQELEKRDSRIRSRDEELKDKGAEIASLSSLNEQLRQENERLIAQNQKLEAHAQKNIDEVEALRAASQDYVQLETALSEAQANAVQLNSEIVALELLNSELKARLDDLPPFAGTSHGRSNLESELSQSDFREAEDEAPPALNDGNASGGSQDGTAPAEITPLENLRTPQDNNEASELLVSPEATNLSLIDPPSRLTRSQGTVMVPEGSQTDPFIPQPVFILKKHNPFHCWFQVYLDLWVLFVFWFSQRLNEVFGGRYIVSPSQSVAQRDTAGGSSPTNSRGSSNNDLSTGLVGGERVDSSLPVSASGDIASKATTAMSSAGKELPNFWITALTFCFHLLFYGIIIVCISNYRALVHERSIWLSANEITRQYLQHYFKISFKPEYGIIHEIFGPVEFLDVWRYNVHSWAQIDRSLPG